MDSYSTLQLSLDTIQFTAATVLDAQHFRGNYEFIATKIENSNPPIPAEGGRMMTHKSLSTPSETREKHKCNKHADIYSVRILHELRFHYLVSL